MFGGQVHYNCPICGDRVWVAGIFGVLKGSPCFNCIGKLAWADIKQWIQSSLLIAKKHPMWDVFYFDWYGFYGKSCCILILFNCFDK